MKTVTGRQPASRRRTVRNTALVAGSSVVSLAGVVSSAGAVPANIHIHGTAPENVVNIRPQPNTSQPAIGSIPEGASPDYNCFTYGQQIGPVPIWFSVNYGGVTGFYASFYDDSSYASDAELTGKYGVPKCGAVNSPPPSSAPSPPSSAPSSPSPSPATPAVAPPGPASPVAAPSEATQSLPPDPNIWCGNTAGHRYDTQIREAEWTVLFGGVRGTTHANDWKCRFLVARTIPSTARGGENFKLPPTTEYVNVDFADACRQQFPGSKLHYVQGPIYTSPWPWECLGVAGRYYPPPGLRLASMVRTAGYDASAIQAGSAGAISLRLTTAKSGAPTLARGSRVVKRRGAYKVRVKLTRDGRRFLRHRKALRVRFRLRFEPARGRVTASTTTVTVNR